MLKEIILALVFVTVGSCQADAQRAVVCPPNLSYCYEKPVLPRMTDQDSYNQLKAELDADIAATRARMKAADYGLEYQLNRARYCNSLGC